MSTPIQKSYYYLSTILNIKRAIKLKLIQYPHYMFNRILHHECLKRTHVDTHFIHIKLQMSILHYLASIYQPNGMQYPLTYCLDPKHYA